MVLERSVLRSLHALVHQNTRTVSCLVIEPEYHTADLALVVRFHCAPYIVIRKPHTFMPGLLFGRTAVGPRSDRGQTAVGPTTLSSGSLIPSCQDSFLYLHMKTSVSHTPRKARMGRQRPVPAKTDHPGRVDCGVWRHGAATELAPVKDALSKPLQGVGNEQSPNPGHQGQTSVVDTTQFCRDRTAVMLFVVTKRMLFCRDNHARTPRALPSKEAKVAR